MPDPGFKPTGKPFQFDPNTLAKFNNKPVVGNVAPDGEFYSDDRNEIKNYLLTIPDMAKRRAESIRIHRIREQRRKAYQARLRQSDAPYQRQARKSRIAAGIPAAKHAASRNAGNRAMQAHVLGRIRGTELRRLGYRTPLEHAVRKLPK